jgi:hypothetical protein
MFESEVRCLPCFESVTFEDLEAGASNVPVFSRHSREKVLDLRRVERKFEILLEVLTDHACGVPSLVVSTILLNQNRKSRGYIIPSTPLVQGSNSNIHFQEFLYQLKLQRQIYSSRRDRRADLHHHHSDPPVHYITPSIKHTSQLLELRSIWRSLQQQVLNAPSHALCSEPLLALPVLGQLRVSLRCF